MPGESGSRVTTSPLGKVQSARQWIRDFVATVKPMAFPSHSVLGLQKIVRGTSGSDPSISAAGNLDRFARSTSIKGQATATLTLESWLPDRRRPSGQW